MAVVELRLPELYRGPDGPPPGPGWTGSVEPYQVREMEAAVRGAMRQGRISLDQGKEELRLLGLCGAALRKGTGLRSVPVRIHDEPWTVRRNGKPTGEKSRQKKARRGNRRPKRRRKR